MNIILFGPPGVGKGTQAQLLADKYDLVRFSSGDLLREQISSNTPIGRQVEQFLRKGHLVPDDIMYEMISNFLLENRDRRILFDGFPRNLNQARSLETNAAQMGKTIDIAFEMRLDEDEIVKRLVNRRYCPKCGCIYNCTTDPPKEENICDHDRTPLVTRDDDTVDVIRSRITVYEDETRPMVDYYKSLGIYHRIDARGNRDAVLRQMSDVINDYLTGKCRSN